MEESSGGGDGIEVGVGGRIRHVRGALNIVFV